MIRGIVTSGSYKDCIVDVLNKGLSNGLGKIFIDSYKDICKYNIRIVSKPIGSEGKKNVGEMTYLNKENITLQTNCACTDVGCVMSHLPFPVTPPVFQAPPSPASPSFPYPSSLLSYPIPSPRSQLIEMLVKKYAYHRGIDSIMSIRISHETMKQYGGSDHVNAFVRMACLCIRVLVEQYCKDVTFATHLQARELVSLAFQRGIINKEKEQELSDILTFTNVAIHSCCIVNCSVFLQKIDKALETLVTL